MKIKVSEATPTQLDWLVAKCEGWVTYPTDSKEQGEWYHTNAAIAPLDYEHNRVHRRDFNPSTDWARGGPIIERERVCITQSQEDMEPLACIWVAEHLAWGRYAHRHRGKTTLIAAMRCYVSSKLGDEVEVEVPEFL